MGEPLIEFRKVTKRFGENIVLNGVDLKIYEGEVTTIIGLSGAGKSVLLKHIIGLMTPDEGEILFRGQSLAFMGEEERARNFAQISYMFQNNALFDSLTVYENVALPLTETTQLSRQEVHRKVIKRLEQMELMEAAEKYPSELSGGMQKRAALARALVTDPHIVLFDEPTSGQDPVRKNSILTMIAQYQKKFGFTAILVSHEIPDVYFISNRILALYHGKIVFQGTPEELEHFDHPFQDEVLKSLEELKQELTGLYSKRLFKAHYQSILKRKLGEEYFTAIVFTVEPPEGEIAYQVGTAIANCFSSRGGFTIRNEFSEFITFLPFTSLAEGEEMLRNFIDERLQELKLPAGVVLNAGLSGGHPGKEVKAIINEAKSELKAIFRF